MSEPGDLHWGRLHWAEKAFYPPFAFASLLLAIKMFDPLLFETAMVLGPVGAGIWLIFLFSFCFIGFGVPIGIVHNTVKYDGGNA